MLRFEWNSLRPGDEVAVHHDSDRFRLHTGVVELVQTLPGNNDVAVRIGGPDHHPLTRPPRLAVHALPIDPTEECWRCELLAEQAGTAPGVATAHSR